MSVQKIVECVPNFSEGKRKDVVEKILDEIGGVPGVKLLDHSSDESHNRTVVTFVGDPDGVKEAAFKSIKKAAELIDMEKHRGEHPRMGATDVVPFIPISGVDMEDCVRLARQLGEKLGNELGIPIYLYEEAATRPERKNLANVRTGQYEGLKTAIKDPERIPDYGPAEMPKAGATAVGARPPLIAYNINLGTGDIKIARKIARIIRGSGGGFVSVKALGVMLEDRNLAQVSINMCNYKEVPLYRVFELVKIEAARYGVSVVGSEIVGLVPMDALLDTADYHLRLEGFKMEQVLETRI